MTQTFSNDSNNDLFLGHDGNISISSGVEAVKFACQTASQAQRGEMIFSVLKGIPNFQVTWAGAPNFALFESYVRNTLEGVDGVVEVTELSSQLRDNVLSYDATIKTIYGDGVLNV